MPEVIITKLPLTSIFDPVQDIAPNLQYTDPATNSPVTQLVQSLYVPRIGNAVSGLIDETNDLNATVTGIQQTLNSLSIPSPYQPPTIVASGIMGDNNAHPFQDVLNALASQYSGLAAVLGTVGGINNTINVQPSTLASQPVLSGTGTMGQIRGWAATPVTLSDTTANQWLTILDIRAAVASLQQLTAVSCKDICVNFNPVLIGRTLTLYFQGYTFIPTGFSDTGKNGSVITVTDTQGNTFSQYINITNASTGAPITMDLSVTNLNPLSAYTLSLASSIGNGTLTCAKTIALTVTNNFNSCPVLTLTSTANSIAVVFTPPLTSGVTYTVNLYDPTGETVLNSQQLTPNASNAPLSATFNNLAASTAYKVGVIITVAGVNPVTCAQVTKATASS